MNISETNFTNITKYGYDLNKNIAQNLFPISVLLVIFLLIGVSLNCFELYVYTFKRKKGDKFGTILLALFDLTVCVLGSSCGLVLNTNPINFISDSLCKFMLSSNMLFANLSLVCILNVTTYRYILLRYPLYQIKNNTRKLLTVIGMLIAIGFSIPSFIFYGETDIVVLVQNATISGKICGTSKISYNGTSGISDNRTSRTSGNGTLFQVYPIALIIVYTIVISYLSFIQMHLAVLVFRGLKKRRQKTIFFPFETNADSKIKKKVKIMDSYADKDFSVLDSDALICSSCDELDIKTTYENNSNLKMKSAYEMMLDIDISMISVSGNTNLIDDTSNNLNDSNNRVFGRISHKRLITWYVMQSLLTFSFAINAIGRAVSMFVISNVWSEISEIEFSWSFIFLSVLSSATNPFYYSLFTLISFLRMRCAKFLRLRMEIVRKKDK